MRIHLFVANTGSHDDPPWVVGAWDEYSIDANPEGYESDFLNMQKKHDGAVAVLIVNIPDGSLHKAFRPQQVQGEVATNTRHTGRDCPYAMDARADQCPQHPHRED